MIEFKKGDMFKEHSDNIICTVNSVGVMGTGVAKEVKNRFPEASKYYVYKCKKGLISEGDVWICDDIYTSVIFFATKNHWRNDSNYSMIDIGLTKLVGLIYKNNIHSLTMPKIGCGNGGLDWDIVKDMIKRKLGNCKCDITIYE